MFPLVSVVSGMFARSLAARSGSVLGVALALSVPSAALADRHDGDRRHHDSRGGVFVSASFGDYGSGVGFSYSNGWRRYDRCDDFRPRPYYRPVVTCAPIYRAPVCTTPVVIERPVYVERPVTTVVERPVYVDRPVVVQQPVVVERPAGVEAPCANDRELANTYLRLGDPDNALRVFQRLTASNPSDAGLVRGLGLAQLMRGDAASAASTIARAYAMDSGLARYPLAADPLGGVSNLQRMLDTTTAYAQRAVGAGAAEGWFTVAVMQQAFGQRDGALNALQQARAAGLNPSLQDAMVLALGR